MTPLDEPNPPNWPPSVKIFRPSMTAQEIKKSASETQDPIVSEQVNVDGTYVNITTHTSAHHFVNRRWALLFESGNYSGIDIEVGYYVQLLGLGRKADDVKFVDCERGPHVPSLDQTTVNVPWGLGLDTFWRSAENFYANCSTGMNWVVSQAAPLRRVHVATDLNLFYGGAYVSGGVLANAVIDGTTNFGGQQQWLCRNVDFAAKPTGGAWSTVFVGCTGQPESFEGTSSRPSVSVDKKPRVRVEKPYIVLENGIYELRVPQPTFGPAAVGSDLVGETDMARDFRRVRVARDDDYNTESLQEALDRGLDLVFSPGIYHLTTSLKVKNDNQVILGLGLATLVAPRDGSPCIRVLPETPGVRVAGIMLQASKQEHEKNYNTNTRDCPDNVASLLEWGYPNRTDDKGQPNNPGVLTDVFARVGGPDLDRSVSTNVMIRIHSGNVVGDNLWLWRADHTQLEDGKDANYPNISPHYHQTMKDECKCANGLIVNGDDVTIHGLAVEHTEEHQVIWKGNRGRVSFYQSELPYDVTHFSFGAKDYTGYLIDDSVDQHVGLGMGIYSNFRDYRVGVNSAIRHPNKSGIRLSHLFTVRLDNFGTIESVVNGQGLPASQQGKPFRVNKSFDTFLSMPRKRTVGIAASVLILSLALVLIFRKRVPIYGLVSKSETSTHAVELARR